MRVFNDWVNAKKRGEKTKKAWKKRKLMSKTSFYGLALEQTRGIFSRIHYYFTQMYSLLLQFFFFFFFNFFYNKNNKKLHLFKPPAQTNCWLVVAFVELRNWKREEKKHQAKFIAISMCISSRFFFNCHHFLWQTVTSFFLLHFVCIFILLYFHGKKFHQNTTIHT